MGNTKTRSVAWRTDLQGRANALISSGNGMIVCISGTSAIVFDAEVGHVQFRTNMVIDPGMVFSCKHTRLQNVACSGETLFVGFGSLLEVEVEDTDFCESVEILHIV